MIITKLITYMFLKKQLIKFLMVKNFALIGCAGYIAPKHLQAIKESGNELVAALDKSDSVGILDKYFDEVHFFTEFERFDRHAEKLRRLGEDKRIHYVSVCSPNYLHDAHIRFAFRIGADAICEKPLIVTPWGLDEIEKLEKETGRRVFTVLQLRLHPDLIALKNEIEKKETAGKYDVELTYITPRGRWYQYSWKGDADKSGGLVTNLGIHFFDLLMWIFGPVIDFEVHYIDKYRASGYLELEKAKVKWFLSIDKNDLPANSKNTEQKSAYRSLKVNQKEIEFSEVFADLHTEIYKNILNGNGIGIKEARPSINLTYKIRNSIPKIFNSENLHELFKAKKDYLKKFVGY